MSIKHFQRLVHVSSLTPAEQQKYLEDLKLSSTQAPVSSSGNKSVQLGPIENIPDIHTAFSGPGCAVLINNKSGKTVSFGFTFNGSQKGYYKYDIENGNNKGNGMGADSFTHHSLIIEIPINDSESYFFVPAFQRYEEFVNPAVRPEIPVFTFYRAKGKAHQNPLFSDPVGQKITTYLIPNVNSIDVALNYHLDFTCHSDSISGS